MAYLSLENIKPYLPIYCFNQLLCMTVYSYKPENVYLSCLCKACCYSSPTNGLYLVTFHTYMLGWVCLEERVNFSSCTKQSRNPVSGLKCALHTFSDIYLYFTLFSQLLKYCFTDLEGQGEWVNTPHWAASFSKIYPTDRKSHNPASRISLFKLIKAN